nr:hypothetical protein [Tanacetum cinerariifolium]
SILLDLKVTLTKHRRMIKPYSSPRFNANYFNIEYSKMEVKGPDMPLLAHMLNLGEPAFVQAQQQDVAQPPPSPVVAPHPLPDPIPLPPRQSSPPPIPFGPAPTSGVSNCRSYRGTFKEIFLTLDPKTEELDEPLRISLRKKSIARKRTLPSPSKPKSDALPFDKDDPEAAFKSLLNQLNHTA